MSDIAAPPLVLFTTRTNTELGAEAISVADDGSIVFTGVVKKVTESMLQSYARSMLGEWTPNRAALRYSRDEMPGRRVKKLGSDEELDLEAVLALAT
jgi:hypothetical protein